VCACVCARTHACVCACARPILVFAVSLSSARQELLRMGVCVRVCLSLATHFVVLDREHQRRQSYSSCLMCTNHRGCNTLQHTLQRTLQQWYFAKNTESANMIRKVRCVMQSVLQWSTCSVWCRVACCVQWSTCSVCCGVCCRVCCSGPLAVCVAVCDAECVAVVHL